MPKNSISRHILMTSGRSGSNYLSNILNLHPQVVNYGEVLAKMIIPYKLYEKCKRCPWTVEEYLDAFYSNRLFFYTAQCYSAYSHFKAKKAINFKRRGNVKSIGMKDFFLNIRVRNAENFFISRPDIAVIYLYRENLLKRYLSTVFLAKTKMDRTEKSVSVTQVVINLPDMMKKLAALERERAEENRMLNELRNHRILSIKYEDYFVSEQSITDYNCQIFEFLGVKPLLVTSQHKKILPQQLSKMIENYQEFCASLVNTQYEQYLDEVHN